MYATHGHKLKKLHRMLTHTAGLPLRLHFLICRLRRLLRTHALAVFNGLGNTQVQLAADEARVRVREREKWGESLGKTQSLAWPKERVRFDGAKGRTLFSPLGHLSGT